VFLEITKRATTKPTLTFTPEIAKAKVAGMANVTLGDHIPTSRRANGRHRNGNGHSDGNGHSNGNGNGHANGKEHGPAGA